MGCSDTETVGKTIQVVCSDTETVDETIQVVCSDTETVYKWCVKWEMKMGQPKTELTVSPRKRQFDRSEIKVRCSVLPYKEAPKLLGIPFDERLDFKRHIAISLNVFYFKKQYIDYTHNASELNELSIHSSHWPKTIYISD